MSFTKSVDVSEISWPAAVASIVICLILSVKSCSENNAAETTARTKSYLENGCQKVAIKGSTGTHWLCEKTK